VAKFLFQFRQAVHPLLLLLLCLLVVLLLLLHLRLCRPLC
jgi:hypothetical protein